MVGYMGAIIPASESGFKVYFFPLAASNFEDRPAVILFEFLLTGWNRLDAAIYFRGYPPKILDILAVVWPVETAGDNHEIDIAPTVGGSFHLGTKQNPMDFK